MGEKQREEEVEDVVQISGWVSEVALRITGLA